MKAARQLSVMPAAAKRAMPAETSSASEPPPTLCEVFHTDILKLRSFCENQWAMTRPHGGHPIPEIQPAASMKAKSTPQFTDMDVENGITPTHIITVAARMRPTTRNLRASERSDRLPMMNLLKAYAMGIPAIATPALSLSSSPSEIMPGAASERFLRTR